MKTQNLQQKIGMLLTVSDPIKFLTKSIESSLCDYFDAHILVTANILYNELLLQQTIILFK